MDRDETTHFAASSHKEKVFSVGTAVVVRESCDQKSEAELRLKCQESRGSGSDHSSCLGCAAALPLTSAA